MCVHVKSASHQYSIAKEDKGNSKEMTQNVQDELKMNFGYGQNTFQK
jgi:hypothetical protein